MRHIFFLFWVSMILLSCRGRSSFRSSRIDSLAPIDTTCRRELKSAQADISKGMLTYCHFIGMLSPEFRNEREFISELRKYNIAYRTELISDVVTDQTQGCYCDLMSDEIRDRYGNNFIDSLLNISDSIYLSKEIDDTISYVDCDTWPRYPGDKDSSKTEQSAVLQARCDSLIKYPAGYDRKVDSSNSAFVNVYFVVNKIGEATIVGYHFLFDRQRNGRYEGDFSRQFVKIVSRHGWTPAQIRKQNVNSEFTLRVYLE